MLDVQSIEMDGFKSSQIVKIKYPDVKIIILSHLRGYYYLRYAIHSGVLGYFTKDSDPNDLLQAIRKANSGEFYFEDKLKVNVAKITKELKGNFDDDSLKFDFSPRELQIIYWSAKELKSKEIANKLSISPRTVEGHKEKLIKKANCKSFLGVILIAVEMRFISLHSEL